MNILWSNGDLVLSFWILEMLLNDRNSDDDDLESRAGVKPKSELLQQLLKPEKEPEDDRKHETPGHRDDNLLRSLGFPPSPTNDRPRKRPSEDRDEGPNSKRDSSQVSSSGNSLRERNKMLARLLAQEPVINQPIPPIPAHEITATPQEKLPRITDPNKNIQLAMAAQSNVMSNSITNAMNNRLTNSMGGARMNVNRMPGRPSQTANYLNVITSTLRNNDVRHQLNQVNSNCYPATSSTTTNPSIDNNNLGVVWDNNNISNQMQLPNDPVLSEILDQVLEIVPDDIMQLLGPASGDIQGNNVQARLAETIAIEGIQNMLMQYESVLKSTASLSMPGTPPAYSTANLSNQTGVFSHPSHAAAKLQQRNQQMRLGGVTQQYVGNNLNLNNLTPSQQQQLLLQQKKIQQQQQEKRRLLLQQKQQQLLIPSNAAVNEINSMQNIDSLLNNTVAPNVTLKRSSSVPEPQLSPGYGGQLTTQSQRVGAGQQQPYSPHSQLTSPLGQQNFSQTTTAVNNYPNPAQRLSPQSQFNAQLSPRQAFPQPNNQNQQWQQQSQVRLTMQQNPMLTAQLTRPSPQTANQPQQQRPLNSPSSVVQTRHSPYPADQFPPPTSPTSAFNNQYLRLQRANSAPTATTQLPGVSASGPTSEFVRQELRAVVGARTAQAQPTTPQPAPQTARGQQAQMIGVTAQQQQSATVSDLESLGITFEMPPDFYGGEQTR